MASTEHLKVPLAEEQLAIQKTSHAGGEAAFRKVVQEQQVNVNVPITKESVSISRHAPTSAQVPADAFRAKEILVPTRVEDVQAVKTAVVREEVDISKIAQQELRPVTDTLRREDLVEVGMCGCASCFAWLGSAHSDDLHRYGVRCSSNFLPFG